MAIHESIDGVVVRVRDVGDRDRYLSVLTADRGRISILSKGSHSVRSPQVAISQLYTYGNFEYYRRGDFNILKDGSSVEPFYGLSRDIDRLNLASYFCDVICELTDEGVEAGEQLRLLLNSLHALSRDLYPMEQIKGAFEFRIAAMSGYEPDLSGCARCGKNEGDSFYLDVMNGSLLCPDCLSKGGAEKGGTYADEIREAEILCLLPPSVKEAMRYCLRAPLSRLFSFEIKDAEELALFAKRTETYLLAHVGHGFDSLHFYHTMREPTPAKKELT